MAACYLSVELHFLGRRPELLLKDIEFWTCPDGKLHIDVSRIYPSWHSVIADEGSQER